MKTKFTIASVLVLSLLSACRSDHLNDGATHPVTPAPPPVVEIPFSRTGLYNKKKYNLYSFALAYGTEENPKIELIKPYREYITPTNLIPDENKGNVFTSNEIIFYEFKNGAHPDNSTIEPYSVKLTFSENLLNIENSSLASLFGGEYNKIKNTPPIQELSGTYISPSTPHWNVVINGNELNMDTPRGCKISGTLIEGEVYHTMKDASVTSCKDQAFNGNYSGKIYKLSGTNTSDLAVVLTRGNDIIWTTVPF